MTVAFCKKRLAFLRDFADETVRRELHRAGLAWLARRVKSRVPRAPKPARDKYCRWLLGRNTHELKRFAYTGGTSFYLARTEIENEDKQRAGLGRFVWRIANGKDGLWG